MDDDAILALVTRLARPHRSGGQVIERAAILAAGADSAAITAWLLAELVAAVQATAPAPPMNNATTAYCAIPASHQPGVLEGLYEELCRERRDKPVRRKE